MERTTVGIVGYGRFGRLWANLLAPYHEVLVSDVALDQPPLIPVRALCERARAIFLCVPINQFDNAVAEIAPHVQPGTVVFDTCSVKVHPAAVLSDRLGKLEGVSLVATHPMFGPDSAANGVNGLPMVVWPLSENDRTGNWLAFFEQLGLRTVRMPPDEHDRLAAYSQGVTHYVGRVLQQLELQATPIDTEGFKILRSLIAQTCNDSWELFHDLQTYNGYTLEMRQKLERALELVNGKLEDR